MGIKIGLVGGGTGGHFYPLIAIAEELQTLAPEATLLYFGPEPYNQADLTACNMQYVKVPAGKRRKYRSILNYVDIFRTLWGAKIAVWKLFWYYPDVIVSKGGYTSVPVVLAAAFLRIPVVIHESDAVPGKANLLVQKVARYIAISYDGAAKYFPKAKTALIGIPIRRSFFASQPNPHDILGIPADKPVIFVTGGSLGAARINTLILDSLDELLPHYTLVHQVGTDNVTSVQETALARNLPTTLMERYFIMGHLTGPQMAAAQSAAALIISRAGSTSIFEAALKGKPTILIPIPEDISHDQRTNAYSYAQSGGGSVIEEHNLTDGLLTAEITRIMTDQAVYDTMTRAARAFTTPNAAVRLATIVRDIAREH